MLLDRPHPCLESHNSSRRSCSFTPRPCQQATAVTPAERPPPSQPLTPSSTATALLPSAVRSCTERKRRSRRSPEASAVVRAPPRLETRQLVPVGQPPLHDESRHGQPPGRPPQHDGNGFGTGGCLCSRPPTSQLSATALSSPARRLNHLCCPDSTTAVAAAPENALRARRGQPQRPSAKHDRNPRLAPPRTVAAAPAPRVAVGTTAATAAGCAAPAAGRGYHCPLDHHRCTAKAATANHQKLVTANHSALPPSTTANHGSRAPARWPRHQHQRADRRAAAATTYSPVISLSTMATAPADSGDISRGGVAVLRVVLSTSMGEGGGDVGGSHSAVFRSGLLAQRPRWSGHTELLEAYLAGKFVTAMDRSAAPVTTLSLGLMIARFGVIYGLIGMLRKAARRIVR